MGLAEDKIRRDRFLNLAPNERRFKANCGMAWIGKMSRLKNGDVLLKNARPFHGLPEGFPDTFGWDEIEVTPDMVGTKIAVFVGEEIKAGADRMRPAQSKFKSLIEKMGGVFRILRD